MAIFRLRIDDVTGDFCSMAQSRSRFCTRTPARHMDNADEAAARLIAD